MTQVWVLWWPKDGAASTETDAAVSTRHRDSAGASPPNCCGLAKFLGKLKRRSKMLVQRRRITGSRQSASTQCRYDPHSYSLNFDASGCGGLLDEDYHQFHAFSSRYAAANPGTAACRRRQMASSH